MTRLALGLALALGVLPALAQTSTYRDAAGRSVGTASLDRNGTTTFRDPAGRSTGTARTDANGTVTLRDAAGRSVGTVRTR